MLAQAGVGIAAIANEVGLSRQAVYRIKDYSACAEAPLARFQMPATDARAGSSPARFFFENRSPTTIWQSCCTSL